MNKEQFKTDLKTILVSNKQPIGFTIIYNGREIYNTKREFGLRLLELLEDKTIDEVYLSTVTEKGYYGNVVTGFGFALRNNLKNIEQMTFTVVTKKQVTEWKRQEESMTPMQRAIRDFGTSA